MKKLFREWCKGWKAFTLAYCVVLPLGLLIELLEALEEQKWLDERWKLVTGSCVLLVCIFLYPFFALGLWRSWFPGGKPHNWICSVLSKDDNTDARPRPSADRGA